MDRDDGRWRDGTYVGNPISWVGGAGQGQVFFTLGQPLGGRWMGWTDGWMDGWDWGSRPAAGLHAGCPCGVGGRPPCRFAYSSRVETLFLLHVCFFLLCLTSAPESEKPLSPRRALPFFLSYNARKTLGVGVGIGFGRVLELGDNPFAN